MRFAMLSLALSGCLTYAKHEDAKPAGYAEIVVAELASAAVLAALPANQSNGEPSQFPYGMRFGAYLGGIMLLDLALSVEEKR